MDLLFWITVGFIVIGLVVFELIKRNVRSGKISSAKAIIWWIVGITVWGITSIFLVVRLFWQ